MVYIFFFHNILLNGRGKRFGLSRWWLRSTYINFILFFILYILRRFHFGYSRSIQYLINNIWQFNIFLFIFLILIGFKLILEYLIINFNLCFFLHTQLIILSFYLLFYWFRFCYIVLLFITNIIIASLGLSMIQMLMYVLVMVSFIE